MIHKLFFGCGIIMLIIAAVLHHRYYNGFMPCLHHRMNHKKCSELMMKYLSGRLKLNENQQLKLRAIRDDFMGRHESQYTSNENQLDFLMHELERNKLDKDRLNTLFEEKMAKMDSLRPQIIDHLVEFHAMLSSEQRAKLVELIRKHHQRMGKS